MSITVRISTEDDVEAIACIERTAFSMPWSVNAFTDAVKSRNYIYLTALEDNQIVGYAGCTVAGDEGDITNIAVTEECRGCGIGEMLMRKLLEQACSAGVMQLFLEVRESNKAARALYAKTGFEITGVRKNFYQKPAENAILMKWNKI